MELTPGSVVVVVEKTGECVEITTSSVHTTTFAMLKEQACEPQGLNANHCEIGTYDGDVFKVCKDGMYVDIELDRINMYFEGNYNEAVQKIEFY
ncbi:hypothetical protein GGI21_003002, partial [Coemansia aciculifera]